MKKASFIIAILICSQFMTGQENLETYDALWKKVQQFDNENLPKSASQIINVISEKAKKEKNTPQFIKALLYSSKYAMTLEEDAQLKIINDFKSEIGKAETPTKNILESYLANLYWQYFQQNRYQFYNRTKTAEKVDSTDFRTWDLTTLFKEISVHFEASLKNKEALQLIPISDFDVLINQQKDSEKYRPTIYDLLAHNALAFYKTSENSITRPADKFEIDQEAMLCEAPRFMEFNIKTKDETSLQAKALRIYQDLLIFHTRNSTVDAYTMVDIERLQFIKDHAIFKDKEIHYVSVLKNSAEAIKSTPNWGLYHYEIAVQYRVWGQQYQPETNEEPRWKLKEAIAIAEKIITTFPESVAADKSKALKAQILSKELSILNEKYVPILEKSRLLIRYKNVDSIYVRAYKSSPEQLEELEKLYDRKKKADLIHTLTLTKEWSSSLKNELDYQQHTTEISIPELENGYYILVASVGKKLENSFAYSPLQATNMALVEHQNMNDHTFQVIDRTNGEPLDGVSLRFSYHIDYNRKSNVKTFVTDENGMVVISKSNQNWTQITIKASKGTKKAFFGDYYIHRAYNSSPHSESTQFASFLFTDRSIYRPGQALYFKGIAMSRNGEISTVLENTSVKVALYDANQQEIKQLAYTTNEYGSFSGEFILPNNGLTGNYNIIAFSENISLKSAAYFSVEEYKRPKFEASFNPVTETFKVNDTITLGGIAQAYSGSNITDAKVSYRVKRVVNFPRWYYWSSSFVTSLPQEIAFGETTTDASGIFKIDFKAIPDSKIAATSLPTFSYEVTADITDLNGETHSATTIVNVGYHALTATIQVAPTLDKDQSDQQNVNLLTHNLNGQFVSSKGTLKIYKLKAPDYVLRPRPWSAPDYTNFSKEEFRKLFPNEAYGNEHNSNQWKKSEVVWTSNFDTKKETKVGLPSLEKWPSGKYLITLETTDKFGQLVQDKVQTTLVSAKDKTLADHQLFAITTDQTSYTPGEKAKIKLSSAAKELVVTVAIEKDYKIIETKIIKLSENSEEFTIPVRSGDLGGFKVNYSFAAFNSFESGSLVIPVPYPSMDLSIETGTFRDKLQPGTDETWSFKIKGPKGDQVAAEILASMYDASLDAFKPHAWNFNPLNRPNYYSRRYSNANNSFGVNNFRSYWILNSEYSYYPQYFDTLDWFGLQFGYSNYGYTGSSAMRSKRSMASAPAEAINMEGDDLNVSDNLEVLEASTEVQNSEKSKENKVGDSLIKIDFGNVQIRKNLQETAFFFPNLQTDKDGTVSFNFTTPEALTQWKLQLVAHTKNLQSATKTLKTLTQKELMVTPNVPRFLREGDKIILSTKIANLTENSLKGQAKLVLTDAVTNKEMNTLISGDELKEFTVDATGNTQVSWTLTIPEGLPAVHYKILAKAGDFSDGEQNVLPVLSNRMLVTESLPMWVRSNQTKTFSLDKLQKNTSSTLTNHKLTLEITSNPAWYAVQALPYLMEYPYECNEQTFARYYANSLASHIANSNPRIEAVFNQWANSDALLSNLEKNEELKSLLIQETPWLRDAQSETEQKKRIALLFNMNKMKAEQAKAFHKLEQNQLASGAWSWFARGRENRYITQHIISSLGHLEKLTSSETSENAERSHRQLIEKAISYLDAEFVTEYQEMKKYEENLNDDHLSNTQVHYLYMRSFFKDIKTSKKVDEIIQYYLGQAQQYWSNRNLYTQGMLALVLHRMDDAKTANAIIKSLKENSITSEELGMYWKQNTSSWYWYQAPIETQSLLIEAFSEIQNDVVTIDNLKIWLLKNKQTNQWKTTKATTEAVYALLLQGSDWLSVTDAVELLVGGEKINPSKLENVKIEAGTGYYKTSWNKNEITPKMGEVEISKKGNGIAWGALYWQYFEDLDKISSAETPLQLKKKLFLKKNTATGEQLSEITTKTALKVGDLVRIRIELRADRTMEFVHIKDMRAAGFEPINVLSSYKWQDGLGYYESTKDASTNFFFDYLPQGVYVFEYDLRVNNAGDFSNGITTIQSMYAPEFSSHSEGVRVSVASE